MQNNLFHVADLSPDSRTTIEGILGRPLGDGQMLFIQALDVSEAADSGRAEAWEELQEIIAEAHANVRASGASDDEIEAAIDEACRQVRYGRAS